MWIFLADSIHKVIAKMYKYLTSSSVCHELQFSHFSKIPVLSLLNQSFISVHSFCSFLASRFVVSPHQRVSLSGRAAQAVQFPLRRRAIIQTIPISYSTVYLAGASDNVVPTANSDFSTSCLFRKVSFWFQFSF